MVRFTNLNDFTVNQQELRSDLVEHFLKYPQFLRVLANEIDINERTLKKFLKDGKDIDLFPLLKIKIWLDKQIKYG